MNLRRFKPIVRCAFASNPVPCRGAFEPRSERGSLGQLLLLPSLLVGIVAFSPSLGWAQALTPAAINQAYGFNLLGASYTGAGQTIAVIEDGGAPNLVSDVNKFDSTYGLAALTPTVLNPFGSTDTGWAEETTLDVEYAHAIAPLAKIEVVEAASNQDTDLYTAATYAAAHGASVVSMSFTIPESSRGYDTGADADADATFNPNSSLNFSAGIPGTGQSPVLFVASSGDAGSGVSAPAANPYVVAVGGTTLKVNSNGSYASEVAWSGSGGGTSEFESKPVYQNGVQSSNFRTMPDVAFDADPDTGADFVYDGSTYVIGGTSLSAPCWAGLFALADQDLASKGEPLLSSLTALQAMYATYGTAAYSQAFHDIVGNDSYPYDNPQVGDVYANTAATGYDASTGLGSPIANYLIPDVLGDTPEPTSAALIFFALPLLMRRRHARR